MNMIEFDDEVKKVILKENGMAIANGEEREVVDFKQEGHKSWICPKGKLLIHLPFYMLLKLIKESNSCGKCIICDKKCKL